MEEFGVPNIKGKNIFIKKKVYNPKFGLYIFV